VDAPFGAHFDLKRIYFAQRILASVMVKHLTRYISDKVDNQRIGVCTERALTKLRGGESQRRAFCKVNFTQLVLILGHTDPGRPARDKRTFGYEQVQSYVYITLRAHLSLGMSRDIMEIDLRYRVPLALSEE